MQSRATIPYPDVPCTSITDFEYVSDLHLFRAVDGSRVRPGKSEPDYVVSREYTVRFKLNGDMPWEITVPRGLYTDLVSVPTLLRGIVGRVGRHLEAGIVHDYLYVAWADIEDRGPRKEDKNFADMVMFSAMKAAKVHWFKRGCIKLALILFGSIAFNKDKPPPRYYQF